MGKHISKDDDRKATVTRDTNDEKSAHIGKKRTLNSKENNHRGGRGTGNNRI